MADDFQHGDLAQIGGLLSTLVSATPSRLRIDLDGHKHLDYDGAYDVDRQYALSRTTLPDLPQSILQGRPSGCIHFFGYEQTEYALLCHAVSRRPVEDAGIKHYRAKHVKIFSNPQMPILADGLLLGEGSLSVHIHPRALTVMAGSALTGQPAIV